MTDMSKSADMICSEDGGTKIMEEFRNLYRNRLKNGGPKEQTVKTLEEWVRDLTEQNEFLVKAVEDLEKEALGRVNCIECLSKPKEPEGDEESQESVNVLLHVLKNDLDGLLELMRRLREEGRYYLCGLKFYSIEYKDIFGLSPPENPQCLGIIENSKAEFCIEKQENAENIM